MKPKGLLGSNNIGSGEGIVYFGERRSQKSHCRTRDERRTITLLKFIQLRSHNEDDLDRLGFSLRLDIGYITVILDVTSRRDLALSRNTCGGLPIR